MSADKPEWDNRHYKLILLHDNVRPHIVQQVKKYLERAIWEILSLLLYLLDTASNFHLLQSIQSALSGERFGSYERINNWIDEWFALK